jgi:hypothetical protein
MLLNHLARRVIGLANFVPSEMFAPLQTALGQRAPISILLLNQSARRVVGLADFSSSI